MTEINPYAQGFRDALLSVQAKILATENHEEYATWILLYLDAQLNKSDLDLWHLFAVAQADLSAYPEALTLRQLLRAPTGVLIDGDGRMLFLRLNGTEYDTGVLRLKEEAASLRASIAAAEPKEIAFTVNGRPWLAVGGTPLTYERLCALAGGHTVSAPGLTVTFRGKGKLGEFSGTLVAGASVVASEGMVFNVAHTGGA